MYGLYGLKHHLVEMSGDVTDAVRTDEGTTSKDRGTQLLICEPLSFAISLEGKVTIKEQTRKTWLTQEMLTGLTVLRSCAPTSLGALVLTDLNHKKQQPTFTC